jgi:hypothetical protein
MSIKDEDSGKDDLSLDVAAAVGKTVARMVNRIEALDKERAELIQKLADFRSSLDLHFRKWLPPVLSSTAASTADGAGVRRAKGGAPCPICNFKTEPLHDGRSHLGQEPRQPFTDAELEESGMMRVP